ncbi:MAG: LCP family protein [Streptosporangiaceae bacterium]
MTDSDGDGRPVVPRRTRRVPPPSGRRPAAPGPGEEGYLPGPRPGLYPAARRGDPAARRPAAGEGGHERRAAGEGGHERRAAGEGGPARGAAAGRGQQRLPGRISAGRQARRQRALLALTAVLSALVMLASGSAWALTSYISSSLGRINAGTTGTPASGPLNILVAGVDTRTGLTPRQQAILHVGHAVSDNSDTLMLAHIPASHRYVRVISLPRDSWVDIPGHGMNKINAAFGLGGPRLMVRTVEQATGLRINDYIEVNFLGFVKVIDALGGVDVCLPQAVNDSFSGLHLSAGRHHVDGITALKYARDRHSFAASDLARIDHQHQLLASLLTRAASSGTLADPIRLARLLAAVSSAVQVDDGFNLTALADQMRGIRPGDVSFSTVPLASIDYATKTGQSAVLWDKPAADALFAALRHGHPVPRRARQHRRAEPSRRQVSVDVYNGTMIGGLSAATGAELSRLGFTVHGSALTWQRQDVSQTLIEYPPGQRAAARLVRAVMPGSALRPARRLARVRIVLGSAGYLVTTGQQGAAPSAAGGAGQQTAAQAACR